MLYTRTAIEHRGDGANSPAGERSTVKGDVIDVSLPRTKRTFLQVLASLAVQPVVRCECLSSSC